MAQEEKTKEFLQNLETDQGKTVRNARYRRENRAWLRKSQRIAIKVLSTLKRKNLSRTWLAEELDVSRQQVSKIIKGKENLTLKTIADLEQKLGIQLIEVPDYQLEPIPEDTSNQNKGNEL